MPRVHFHPAGRVKEVKAGSTILAAANRAGLPVGQSCGGDGICGWCRVTILKGAENVSAPTSLERKLLAYLEFSANERASCLATIHGDIHITATYW
jgi:2Fe-2S ferredoxin